MRLHRSRATRLGARRVVLPLVAGLGALLAPAATPPATAAAPAELLARGNTAYAQRADGSRGDRAAPGPIAAAVAAYEAALAAAPADLEARARLLRALYFQGDYATPQAAARLTLHQRARDLAEVGIAQLEKRLGRAVRDTPPAALAAALAGEPWAREILYWGGAHWGLWARLKGKVAAAREGVAGIIRDYAERVLAIDETWEDAGGHRVLGRLHTEAPKIPLVTGWVDRKAAIRHLELAVRLGPGNLLNREYLAEALLEFAPARRGEALALLADLAGRAPRPESAVEEARVIADAKARLAAERRGS